MPQFQCDLCGGKIKMQLDKTGVCENCGMSYDLETLRAMAKPTAAPTPAPASSAYSTENAMIKPSDDIGLDREVLVAYLDDVRVMQTIIHESNALLPKLDTERKKNLAAKQNYLDTTIFDAGTAPVMKNSAPPIEPSKPYIAPKPGFFSHIMNAFKAGGARVIGSLFRVVSCVIFLVWMIFAISKSTDEETITIFDNKPMLTLLIVLFLIGAVLGLLSILHSDKSGRTIELVVLASSVATVLAFLIQNGLVVIAFVVVLVGSLILLFTSHPGQYFSSHPLYISRINSVNAANRENQKKYQNAMAEYPAKLAAYKEEQSRLKKEYDQAQSNYETDVAQRKETFDIMIADKCNEFDARTNEIDNVIAALHTDISTVTEMLEDEYSINIVPSQFRNIRGSYYLFDYISTSRQSLSEAFMQFNLEEIKRKLDRMIEQQGTMILQQREQNVKLGKIIDLSAYIARNTDSIAANTAATAQNTAATAQNTAAIRNNTAVIAQNTTTIAENTAAAARNTAAIAQNTSQIAQNTYAAAQNTAAIRQDTRAIRSNVAYGNRMLGTIANQNNRLNNSMSQISKDLSGARGLMLEAR